MLDIFTLWMLRKGQVEMQNGRLNKSSGGPTGCTSGTCVLVFKVIDISSLSLCIAILRNTWYRILVLNICVVWWLFAIAKFTTEIMFRVGRHLVAGNLGWYGWSCHVGGLAIVEKIYIYSFPHLLGDYQLQRIPMNWASTSSWKITSQSNILMYTPSHTWGCTIKIVYFG